MSDAMAQYQHEYYIEHRDSIRARHRAYNRAHKEEIAAAKRAYEERNRQTIRERQAKHREAHREKISAHKHDYHLRHKEEKAAYQAAHKPERCATEAKRRAAKHGGTVGNPVAIKEIYRQAREQADITCYLCGELIPIGQRHVDHVKALSLGLRSGGSPRSYPAPEGGWGRWVATSD